LTLMLILMPSLFLTPRITLLPKTLTPTIQKRRIFFLDDDSAVAE
jgi:hypothetical protein